MKRFKYGLDFLQPEFKQFVYEFTPADEAATVAAATQQQ